ncbi:MAG: bifunctional diaminohydroxyphosphoribosylaminopyrimidine deaminase/5-amino-6-(5-phosphoribosylamino)uracil reductase RibD [Deltaproteobacteria bacterium]|nr:bifunctional diaminohydroxyphosphoribosylaminopyrimidine deaminase/5-amino-6-(5-phosphoribosylamino)uracil reductase RibD [Deltaproteobacteria bacterium]
MRAAVSLAKRGRSKVSPNPMVGALIVKDGAIIGSGYHRKAGGGHAEINAIRRARESLAGAVMYVNLEPCCHHGKTPPCTEAIIKSGIRKVVAGTIDPNPLVSGRGVAVLRAAGLEVETGVLESECRELNGIFFTNMEKGRPFVTLKLAATLDGKIADREGKGRWITSQSARNEVRRLRCENDAVVVGLGTVQADDPLLLPVDVKSGRKPVRIVLDPMLEMSPESRLAKTAKESRVIVFASESAPQKREARIESASVEIVRTASKGDFLVLPDVLGKIHD